MFLSFSGFLLWIQLGFLFLYMFLLIFGVNVIPIRLDKLPLYLRDNPEYLKGLAWTYNQQSHISTFVTVKH